MESYQAKFALGRPMLIVPSHLLILRVPWRGFCEDLFCSLPAG